MYCLGERSRKENYIFNHFVEEKNWKLKEIKHMGLKKINFC